MGKWRGFFMPLRGVALNIIRAWLSRIRIFHTALLKSRQCGSFLPLWDVAPKNKGSNFVYTLQNYYFIPVRIAHNI